MHEESPSADNEISLHDICEFLKHGWPTAAKTSIIFGAIGICIAYLIPKQFEATAQIETGYVLGHEIDSAAKLAEKMRSPTFMSKSTLKVCGLEEISDPAQTRALLKKLKPQLPRNSQFITVAYSSIDGSVANNCLKAVLHDVVVSQAALSRYALESASDDVALIKKRIEAAQKKRAQEILYNKEKLKSLKNRLASAQSFVDRFQQRAASFEFNDGQFGASALFLTTMFAKQDEIRDLHVQVSNLEMVIRSGLTSMDGEIFDLEKKVRDYELILLPPSTMDAKFASPVYTSDDISGRERFLAIIFGILGGGTLGLVLVAVKRKSNVLKNKEIIHSNTST